MPTNEPLPEWCRDCPNRGVCPIRWTWQSWYCPGKEVLEKQEVQE